MTAKQNRTDEQASACERVQPLLTRHTLGDLDQTNAAMVAAHLKNCEGCRATAREIRPTLDLLQDALAAPSPAAARLDPAHRARVLLQGNALRRRRGVIPWILTGHPVLAAAAGLLIVAGLTWTMVIGYIDHGKKATERRDYAPRIALRKSGEVRSLTVSTPAAPEPVLEPVAAPATVSMTLPKGEVDGLRSTRSRDDRRDSFERELPTAVNVYHLQDDRRAPAPTPPPPAKDAGVRIGYFDMDVSGLIDAQTANGIPTGAEDIDALRGIDMAAGPAGDDKYDKPARALRGKRSGAPADHYFSGKADDETTGVALPSAVAAGPASESSVKGDQIRTAKFAYLSSTEDREPDIEMPVAERIDRDATDGDGWPDHTAEVSVSKPKKPVTENRANEIVSGISPDSQATEVGKKLNVVARRSEAKKTETDGRVDHRDISEAGQDVSRDIYELGETRQDKKERPAIVAGSPDPLPDEPVVAEKERDETDGDGTEPGPRFRAAGVNPLWLVTEAPFSTFAIDVDTASYTLARNYMLQGYLPPAESVRTEEFVNFFDYRYRPPERDTFGVCIEAAPSPFGRGLTLLKIGVKGRRLGREERRAAMLTCLVDTSGSMNTGDRIGLVKKSLNMLLDSLAPEDRLAIVQYSSHARLVLEATPAGERERVRAAIEGLQCSGSTNLEEGMQRAYGVAAADFIPGAENRVLVLSDGVANLGSSAAEDILARVDAFRRQGVTCSVFGFGMGTYNDVMLETLANKGDGSYVFVDSEQEARRVFVEDLGATLNTIAADVKIQVQFDGTRVKRYRQLGYENRQLKREDFRNDAVDAGEVGSGQSVTALYELELQEIGRIAGRLPPLATVRVRYRRTDTGAIEEIERPVRQRDLAGRFEETSPAFRLAACVAEFAEILRGSPFAAGSEYADVARRLRPAALELHLDTRVQELLRMVESAGSMTRGQ